MLKAKAAGRAAEGRSASEQALAASVVAAMGTMDQARILGGKTPVVMGCPACPLAGTLPTSTQ